jgi:hypothetical protein
VDLARPVLEVEDDVARTVAAPGGLAVEVGEQRGVGAAEEGEGVESV